MFIVKQCRTSNSYRTADDTYNYITVDRLTLHQKKLQQVTIPCLSTKKNHLIHQQNLTTICWDITSTYFIVTVQYTLIQ